MKFKTRSLNMKNLVGFGLDMLPKYNFFNRLFEDSVEFKKQMLNNGFYTDGPTFYVYNPLKDSRDVLVFTTVGNKLELKGENNSGIFFQESLNLTTDFYYRHYNQDEPIPYDEIKQAISEAGFKLVNIFHAVLDLYGDYVVDLYCEVEREG